LPVCQPNLAQYLKTRESGWMQSLPSLEVEEGGKPEVRIRLKDLQNRSDVAITMADDQVRPEDTLIRGNFFNRDLRQGLNLRCSNTKEEHAFTSDSSHPEGLSCIFFLQGQVDVRIGDKGFNLGPGRNGGAISAAGVLKKSSQPFQRATKQSQYVRHLVVSTTPEWLASSGFEASFGDGLNRQLQQQELLSKQWQPSLRLQGLIEEVFSPSVLLPQLLDLHLEARAIDIVGETLATLIQANGYCQAELKLGRHEQIRLQRARDFILADPSQALSVEVIAAAAGISASGLQRLFHRVEACSVFDYVRKIRLENAYAMLSAQRCSVQEASSLAGYKAPANFATAFKRHFGKTPRQVSAGADC